MSRYSTRTGSFLARLTATLLGALLGASAARAQSGDPSMDPPLAAAHVALARPRPVRTEGVRTLDGLARHARVQAVVSPRRIAPGEQGVVHVIVEPQQGRGLDDLRITVRSRSGAGVEPVGTGTVPVDEQATTRVVPVPITFASELPHGEHVLQVEVVADVRELVEDRSMGRWRAVVEAAAQLGAALPRPVPRMPAGGTSRPALRAGSPAGMDSLAGRNEPGFRATAPRDAVAPRSTVVDDAWTFRWSWLLTLLAPLAITVLVVRWAFGAEWWTVQRRASQRRGG